MAFCDILNPYWYFIQFHCVLIGSLVASFSVPSPGPIISRVGREVVLPCSWSSRLGGNARLPAANVMWHTPDSEVYERWGQRTWATAEFQGRAAVPEDRLAAGDCSLHLSDVQLIDCGLYESFVVVEGTADVAGGMKKRVFIQSAKLVVHDHKSKQSHGPGEDMVLDLHTPKAHRVVFQRSNSTEWADLWMRQDPDSQRLEKHPDRDQLTVKGLQQSDEGVYKVLDTHGLAISTVQLTVQDKSHHVIHSAEKQVTFGEHITGDGNRHQCSLALLGFCLATITLHLQR